MKNSVFLIFCLIIFSAILTAHAMFREAVSPVPLLEAKILKIEREKKQAEFEADLEASRLADFKSQVAILLPGALEAATAGTSKNKGQVYPLRQLASVVTEQKELSIERSSSLMEKGKAAFREQDYDHANEIFSNLIAHYPDSVHVPEAHFLLAEGQFQSEEYEASAATIDRLVTNFPENELTGFALLRLGRIFEIQDRLEDAADIYKSVIHNFPQPVLKQQAVASLKGVQL